MPDPAVGREKTCWSAGGGDRHVVARLRPYEAHSAIELNFVLCMRYIHLSMLRRSIAHLCSFMHILANTICPPRVTRSNMGFNF